MEELYKLKQTLCNELEEYSKKEKMSAGDLDVVDKLSHTIKNIDKIIEKYDAAFRPLGVEIVYLPHTDGISSTLLRDIISKK